jgi:regulator of sigma E protease
VQTLSVLLGQHPKNPQWGYFGASPQPPTTPVETVIERYGLFEGAWEGVKKTYQTSLLTLKLLGKMLVGEVSLKNIGGPVQTAEVAGVAASIGLIQFIEFLAFFSVSIGVMNLLPIPMLDGGHLLFYVAEAIRGKPLPPKVLAWGQSLGITALMLLMGLAFYNDILRLVG